ncbi:tyrosine-type recombinase/integrase [Methylocystis sp. IM3]|uniref:tyrosine-type recombinase/integrase n=1 Tax=unclassified Methylocystis TaxID=2625913 RepID=UPI0030F913B7
MKQAPVLTERDMKRVLQHTAKARFPARNRCLLMLSWLAGMRVAEIAALKLNDVLAPDGTIRPEIQLAPEQTKGSSARTVLISSQLKSELEAYINSLPANPAPDRPLIASKTGKRFSANGLCQVMLHIYDAAGLDRATSHSGRRTFITTLAHKGVNVRVLAALAGHKHIGTTQRYIDLNENVLRAAVEMI